MYASSRHVFSHTTSNEHSQTSAWCLHHTTSRTCASIVSFRFHRNWTLESRWLGYRIADYHKAVVHPFASLTVGRASNDEQGQLQQLPWAPHSLLTLLMLLDDQRNLPYQQLKLDLQNLKKTLLILAQLDRPIHDANSGNSNLKKNSPNTSVTHARINEICTMRRVGRRAGRRWNTDWPGSEETDRRIGGCASGPGRYTHERTDWTTKKRRTGRRPSKNTNRLNGCKSDTLTSR